jgi:hypothetical protein
MFGVYVFGMALDFVSSLKIKGGADQEINPFARHSNGAFWPQHCLINDGLNTLEILLVSLILFQAGKYLGRKWGIFASGLPWLYFAYGHIDAAFFNIMALWWPGLFVETTQDVLRHLLGGN